MKTIAIEDAKARLSELIHGLTPGDELVITENGRPAARRIAIAPAELRKAPRLETQPGSVVYMASDFDAPLDDFKDYME